MINQDSVAFVLVVLVALFGIGPSRCAAQSPSALTTLLRNKSVFAESDLAAVQRGETLVKLMPSKEKREVAVAGVVRVETTAEEFLKSFRDSMDRKNNAAILEIGRFNNPPQPDDLQALTMEDRDLEDLKNCVVGNCQLKLSTSMIESLRKEIDWQAPDYKIRATQLLKQMLLNYVRGYISRGDEALIQYGDKQSVVRVADDQRQLIEASSYDALSHNSMDSAGSHLETVESVIVWSKIKFGLKPVIAINHITIYKPDSGGSAPILILSKQIYANHYFDSSLAITAFLRDMDQPQNSYLFYENRSRLDGLGGIFGKFKRSVVEDRAVASLESILRHSQLSLQGRGLKSNYTSAVPVESAPNFWRLRVGGLSLVFLLLSTIGAALFLGLRVYNSNNISRGLHY